MLVLAGVWVCHSIPPSCLPFSLCRCLLLILWAGYRRYINIYIGMGAVYPVIDEIPQKYLLVFLIICMYMQVKDKICTCVLGWVDFF